MTERQYRQALANGLWRGPRPLVDERLGSALVSRAARQLRWRDEAARAWERAVGEGMAELTEVLSLSHGRCVVGVRSEAVWGKVHAAREQAEKELRRLTGRVREVRLVPMWRRGVGGAGEKVGQ